MMKAVRFLVLAVALVFVANVIAQEGKEVTLKGKITCAKCDLGKEKTCATVIVVKDGDKETVYYFDKESNKKNHKQICTQAKDGSVTGTVSEEDGKKVVKATKVEFK